MQTYNDLALFYDCRIPKHLREAALRATPTAAAEYWALSPLDRLRADIDRERVAIRLDRRLCRDRDGADPGLLEAHRRYHETGKPYYLGCWKLTRRRLDTHLRVMAARKDKLIELRRQLAAATNEHVINVIN